MFCSTTEGAILVVVRSQSVLWSRLRIRYAATVAIRQHCDGNREIWCKPQLRFCLKSWQSRFATRRFDRFPPQARNKFRRRFLPRIDSFESQFKSIDDGAFSMMLEWKWSCQWIVSLVCFVLSRENFGKSWKQSGSFFFFIFFMKAFFPTMAVIYFVPSLSCTNICRYMIRFILFYFKLEQRICFVHSNFAWIVWKITLMHLFLKVCISVNRVDFYRERWNGSAGKLMGLILPCWIVNRPGLQVGIKRGSCKR